MITLKKTIAAIVLVSLMVFVGNHMASATDVRQDPTHASKTPLEISPVCYSDNQAYWNVNNKDSNEVVITYKVNGHAGTYTAPAGNSKFSTPYQQNDNNTTEFIYTAEDKSTATGYQIDSVSRNASSEECKTIPVTQTPPQTTTTEPTSTVPATDTTSSGAYSSETTLQDSQPVDEAHPEFLGK